MWLVVHQWILTNVEIARCHLSTYLMCHEFFNEAESIDHVLRLCPKVRCIWEVIVKPDKLSIFFDLPFSSWLMQCTGNVAGIGQEEELWVAHFLTFYWAIWKQRFNAIFGSRVMQEPTLVKISFLQAIIAETQRTISW
ncbi:hypothetical protein V6N13_072465 [Hibiscus sabdariffa]